MSGQTLAATLLLLVFLAAVAGAAQLESAQGQGEEIVPEDFGTCDYGVASISYPQGWVAPCEIDGHVATSPDGVAEVLITPFWAGEDEDASLREMYDAVVVEAREMWGAWEAWGPLTGCVEYQYKTLSVEEGEINGIPALRALDVVSCESEGQQVELKNMNVLVKVWDEGEGKCVVPWLTFLARGGDGDLFDSYAPIFEQMLGSLQAKAACGPAPATLTPAPPPSTATVTATPETSTATPVAATATPAPTPETPTTTPVAATATASASATPAAASSPSPTPDFGAINEANLKAAIQNRDIEAITQVMALIFHGLVPEPQAGQQLKQAHEAIAKINQENLQKALEDLERALAADDDKAIDDAAQAIADAAALAETGLVLEPQASQQFDQALEALMPLIFPPKLDISVHSPVDLYVTDPEGRSVGRTSTGGIVNEIPEATYTGPEAEPERIIIPNPAPGGYRVVLMAIRSGPYYLAAAGLGLGDETFVEGFSGTVEPEQVGTNGFAEVFAHDLSVTVGGLPEQREEASPAGGSGPSVTLYALIGGLAAAILALGAGGWYARRRWSK
jgi:hypothetical protein